MRPLSCFTDPRDETRVASILDVDIDTLRVLPPYEPRDEARTSPSRGPRGRYMHASEVDARLAPFVDDALAGVSDRLIARRADLSMEQVRQWRRRRRIQGRRGRTPPELGTRFLVSALLGEETEPVAHETSPVQGSWRPPVYALRRPLDYDLLCRIVAALVDTFTTDQISAGVGIEQRDIELALVMQTERGGA